MAIRSRPPAYHSPRHADEDSALASLVPDDWDAATPGPGSRSAKYPQLPLGAPVTDLDSLRQHDPSMYTLVMDVCSAMKLELLPTEAMQKIVESCSASVQRELVTKIAGLDSSVLLSFKTQMSLIEAVLSRVIHPNGTTNSAGTGLDISVKEAINMSIKLTTAMATHLPKFVKLEKIQRMEAALFEVVETLLTKDQQRAVLEGMDRLNLEAMRKES